MQKKILVLLAGCLLIPGLNAQDNSIAKLLGQIEVNNKELKALDAYIKGKELESLTTNNLPPTDFGGYYLPLGNHNSGNYSEFQVSQTFEFPTVYKARKEFLEQQSIKLQFDYQLKRQEVLLAAKQLFFDIVNLNQRIAVFQNRSIGARTVFEHISGLYEKDQIGVLELNKAKVFWLQQQFKVRQIAADKQRLILELRQLNGDNEVSVDQTIYEDNLEIGAKDSIWSLIQKTDPVLRQLEQEETVIRYRLRLEKESKKPALSAGFNYQGVNGANYGGLFAGVSLPIWSQKGKVEAIEQTLKFQELKADLNIEKAYAHFEKLYNDFENSHLKFREYQSTLGDLHSEELLLQAYEMGEISFVEYYMELSFYREAQDAMLEFEHHLHRLKNEILKHEL